jgi:enamine deaminase RidA (YjgF/YER057c/UK114 family)
MRGDVSLRAAGVESIMPAMDIAKKLAELGRTLPEAPKPVGAYVPAVVTGNLLFVSGQLPLWSGKLLAEGKVPTQTSIELGQKAAAQCAVNALAIVASELAGDWSRLVRAVRMGVFVQCESGFRDQAKVANGASELLQEVLGEAGRHARVTVGVYALPMNAAVEAEFLFEIR